jgi:outer membrane protein insertion porin family
MKSYTLVLAPLIGLCLLQAPVVSAQTTKPQEPAPSSTQRNPFEAVPEAPRFPAPEVSGPIIEAIEFRGARRLPASTLRVLIASHAGGAYDIETLLRDSETLYDTNRFSDVSWETEPGRAGAIVRFVVAERPMIRSIEYRGFGTVTLDDVLERFKQRKLNLLVDSLYHEDELQRATLTLQELLAEKGRQDITVIPLVEPVLPSAVRITFSVEDKQ